MMLLLCPVKDGRGSSVSGDFWIRKTARRLEKRVALILSGLALIAISTRTCSSENTMSLLGWRFVPLQIGEAISEEA